MIAALAAGVVVSACGSGPRQDASEPSGTYRVAASARWATSQHLSEHSQLVITATNTGVKTIPNVAVTITDLANGEQAPGFMKLLHMPGLASQARAVWVVDQAPDPASQPCPDNFNPVTYTGPNFSTCSGGPGGAVTAYANTWALGRLAPGKTATFTWHVTAVQSGLYIVNWRIAAGLNGKARAVSAYGGLPRGSFTVNVATTPQHAYVNNAGQVVNTP